MARLAFVFISPILIKLMVLALAIIALIFINKAQASSEPAYYTESEQRQQQQYQCGIECKYTIIEIYKLAT